MKTFFFDTRVKPYAHTPPVPIMPGHILRGTIQIPFDCEDVPDNAIFRFACDDPQPMESHIIREIHNSAMISKYAVFLVLGLGETKNPAAVALGSIRSEKKAAAVRENGKKGGRPVKQSARIFKNRDGYWTVMLESGEIADGLLQGDEWMRLDLAMACIRRRTDYRPIRGASLDRSI